MSLKSLFPWLAALLLTLIIGRFIVVGLPKILFNALSSDGDESAYLSLSLDFIEEGVWSDGTRPPLYAIVLAPVAEREWAYFTSAKLITLGLGVLTLLATFVVGGRMFGWPAALLAVFLLAANKEFHIRSATVYADVLLALVMVGAWHFLIKSVVSWKSAILAGVFVGLSFLTKGSAPVLLAAWGGLVLLHHRLSLPRLVRQGHLLLVPLFFVIVSAPLLIYNAATFGSPTYNFATQHIMWMDELEQINTADPADLPTAATYFASHSPADIIERVERGLRRLNPVISRSLNPNRTFEPVWLGPALGLFTLGLLLYLLIFQRPALGRYLRRRQDALLFTGLLYGLFYPFFFWYVAGSSAETRFIVPLLAPFYLLLSDAVVQMGRGLHNQLTISNYQLTNDQPPLSNLSRSPAPPLPRSLFHITLSLGVAGVAWWLLATAWADRWALSVNPYQADVEANVAEEALVQWLERDNPTDAVLVSFGPSKSLPLWKIPRRFTIERLPSDIDTWTEMEQYVATAQPAYLILDEDTVRRRREAMATYFQYQRDPDLISFERLPPRWALAHLTPALPCRWCIFTPLAGDPQPIATFANGLQLLDWRVASRQVGESASLRANLPISQSPNLHLSLTWTATTPLPTNYTFFVHLTAPDGFVKAQQDQPPFGNARPTTAWQPGELYADRFELTLDASVGPGEYLLLAGLYDPASGERVELREGPPGPAPATVLLGKVAIE